MRLGQREHDGGQRLQGGEELGDIGLGCLHGAHYEAPSADGGVGVGGPAGSVRRAGGPLFAAPLSV